MIDQLKHWPRQIWLALILWLAVLFWLALPAFSSLGTRIQEIQHLKRQLAEVRQYKVLDKKLESRITTMQTQLHSLSAIVSQDSTQPRFIETIRSLADECHVEISTFTPVRPSSDARAIEITVISRFDRIGRFINRLERHSRLYRIPYFVLEKNSEPLQTIKATLMIIGEDMESRNGGS
jgi:hypothetical protein